MKTSLLLPICTCFFLLFPLPGNAAGQEVFERKISVEVNDEKLKKALKKIEAAAAIKFSYSPQVIRADRKITFSCENEPLGEVLTRLFLPLEISFSAVGNQIVLTKAEAPSSGLLEKMPPPDELETPIPVAEMAVFRISGKITGSDSECMLVRFEKILSKGSKHSFPPKTP